MVSSCFLYVLPLFYIFFTNCIHAFEPNAAHFELIHRHSPDLDRWGYNGGGLGQPKNRLQRLKQLIHSDNARQRVIQNRSGLRRLGLELDMSGAGAKIPVRSAADRGAGQYFVSFRVGSPPQKMVLIVDTGSDLTWVNCKYMCNDCPSVAKANGSRIFYADQSPSFKTIPCSSDICKADLAQSFSLARCPNPMIPCAYDYRYADGSSAIGIFANDTVTMGLSNHLKLRLHDVLIGCTESLQGSFRQADGVMGLGYAKHSFAVKAAQQFGNKFSYCLVDHLSPSNLVNYLTFGNSTVPPHMHYTQLVLGIINPFYAVNVVGISVGGIMLNIPAQVFDVKGVGGFIIDSGSSLTYLAEPAYKPVMAALTRPLANFTKEDLGFGPLEFCFGVTASFNEYLVPKLVFHFGDGALFVPPIKSYVIAAADGVRCLGFASTGWPGTSVIGNIMQQNYLWEFDLAAKRLGFGASACQ